MLILKGLQQIQIQWDCGLLARIARSGESSSRPWRVAWDADRCSEWRWKEKAGEASRRSAADFYKTDDTRSCRIGQGKVLAGLLARGKRYECEGLSPDSLSLEGAEEGSHMGAADFRVGGQIFATLASVKQGYGNLMLTVEQQAAFVEELPGVFVPIAGGILRLESSAQRQ